MGSSSKWPVGGGAWMASLAFFFLGIKIKNKRYVSIGICLQNKLQHSYVCATCMHTHVICDILLCTCYGILFF